MVGHERSIRVTPFGRLARHITAFANDSLNSVLCSETPVESPHTGLGSALYGHALLFDSGAAVFASCALGLWALRSNGFGDLDCFLEKDGTGIYASLLSAWAALLGFAITAVTIVSALISLPQFSPFRTGNHYNDFWFAFVWCIRVLGIAATMSLLALFLNHYPVARNVVLLLNVTMTVAAALSLFRSGRTLEVLLKKSGDLQERERPAPSGYPPVEP